VNRILVGYDGSELSQRALEHACDLALHYDAKLTVLTAVADRLFREDGMLTPALDEERGHEVSGEGAERARQRGVPDVEARCSVEAPDDALVLTAQEGFDLMVVGHRSRSAIAELVLGSTAKAVVDRAPCSVLVVR
jgi:nucleotide-binding universal stress UspA family protein